MKYRIFGYGFVLFCFLLITSSCDNNGEPVPESQKHASNINSIISSDAKLGKVTVGYEFDTAGSPLYMDGDIYFTNNNFDEPEKSRVIKMDASGSFQVLRKNNGVTTTLQHSGKGTLYCCEMLGHRVIEMDRHGTVLRVVCGKYKGTRIDGPNDIVVDRKGGIYFTDSQFIAGQKKMQETTAVYYVKPDGAVNRVIDDIEFPNGVMLSPDENTLYVANTKGKFVLAYDVQSDGTVNNGRNFAELQLSREIKDMGSMESGADGMAVDSAGNIFVATTKGIGIQVFSSKGEHLGNIPCDAATNNCNFGGEDMKTLFVSAKDGIYKIPVKIPGLKMPKG